MLDITIAQILNEIDQIQYILYTEWTSTYFKIMLFKSSAVPLMGEVNIIFQNYFYIVIIRNNFRCLQMI